MARKVKAKKAQISNKSHQVLIASNLLVKSAIDGNFTDAQKWINQGADVNVNAKNEVGCIVTPIVATLIGQKQWQLANEKNVENENFFKIFELLIENGADIDKLAWTEKEKKFHAPLSMAIVLGFYKFVKHLIQKGAKLDIRYRDNTNILFIAVGKNDLETTKLILEHKQVKSKINIKDKQFGYSVLHHAISKKYVEIAKVLIDHGASVNSIESESLESILHTACWKDCDVELVELLVKKGANLESKNRYFDFNGKPICGITPLFITVTKRNVLLTKLLLEHGADVNAKEGEFGTTPLHFLLRELKPNDKIAAYLIFNLLIKYGADIHSPDNRRKWTPLHVMAQLGRAYETKLLLQHGANYKALDKNSSTPLHWAVSEGHLEVAKILVDAGSDINLKDKSVLNLTPLHKACMKNNLAMVKLLVENGAEVNVENVRGFGPIDFLYTRESFENEKKELLADGDMTEHEYLHFVEQTERQEFRGNYENPVFTYLIQNGGISKRNQHPKPEILPESVLEDTANLQLDECKCGPFYTDFDKPHMALLNLK